VDRFKPSWHERLAVVTKLMVRPEFRHGIVLSRLGLALYEFTCDSEPNARFCLIDCIPPLKHLFVRLGYRQIGPSMRHPAAGMVLPMAFPIYNLAHFRRVRSPLAVACPRHDTVSCAWFENTFAAELAMFG
jgi:hypothetical protein